MVSSYWQIASVIVFAIFGAPTTFSERICDQNEQFCLSGSGGDRIRQNRQDIIDNSRLQRRDFNHQGVIRFKTDDIQFRREGPIIERNEIRTRHTERIENRGLRNFQERILSNRIVERSSKDINIHRSHDNLSVYRNVRRDDSSRKDNSFQLSKDLRNTEQTRSERNRFEIRRSASDNNIDTRRNRDDLSFNRNVRREAGNERNRLERFEIRQTISEPREDFNTHTSRDGLLFNRNVRRDESRKENSFRVSKDLRNREEARNEPNRLERFETRRTISELREDIDTRRNRKDLSVNRNVRRDESRKDNSFQVSKDLRNREETRNERNRLERFETRRTTTEPREDINTRGNRKDLSFDRNVRRDEPRKENSFQVSKDLRNREESRNERNRLERFETRRTTTEPREDINTRGNREDLSFDRNIRRDEHRKENSFQVSKDLRNREETRNERNRLERFETRRTTTEPREDIDTRANRENLSFDRNVRRDEPRKENSFQVSKDLRNREESRNERNRLERFETRRTISELRKDIDTRRNRKDLSFNRNVRRDESRKDNSFQVSENLNNREQIRNERNGLERFATRRTTTEPREDINTQRNREDLSFDRNVRRDEPRKKNSFQVSKDLRNREESRNERNRLERFETRRTSSEPRDLRRESSSVLESERRRTEIISTRSNSENIAATRRNDRREHTKRSTRNIDSSRARIASMTRFITNERLQTDVENRLVKPDQIRNYVRENRFERTDISRNLYGSFNTRREINQRYDVIRRQEQENVRRENREVDNNSPRLEREVLNARRENNNLNQRRFERGTMFQRSSLNILSRTQEILPLSNNRRIRETFEHRHENIDSRRRESDRLLVRQQEQLPGRSADNNRNTIELNRRLTPKTSLDYNNREIRRDIQERRDSTQNMRTRSVDSVRFENDRINLESNTRLDERNTRTRTSERRQNDQREIRRDILERNSNNRIQRSSLHIINSGEPRGVLQDTENRVNFMREITRSTPQTHDIVRENLKRYTPPTETLFRAEIPTVQMLQAVLIGFLVFKAMAQHETWCKNLRFYSDVKNLKQILSSAKVF